MQKGKREHCEHMGTEVPEKKSKVCQVRWKRTTVVDEVKQRKEKVKTIVMKRQGEYEQLRFAVKVRE